MDRVIPFYHSWSDEFWQRLFPGDRIVRQVEQMPTSMEETMAKHGHGTKKGTKKGKPKPK